MNMIGHNNPPDPIDEATAPFAAAIEEAANWLDGAPVETEAQMQAVDAIAAEIRAARSALEKARKEATDPLHKAWKAEVARWKPTEDDLERIQKGLAAAVDTFKRKLAAEKAEAQRRAFDEARAKERAAREAIERANASDLEAQRAAAQAQAEAEAAQAAAQAAARDTVKGLRTVWHYEVEDYGAALNDIRVHDRAALMQFVDDYTRAHYRQRPIKGVKTWSEKVAY